MASRVAADTDMVGRTLDGPEDASAFDARNKHVRALRFGPFELDFDRYELRREGKPVALEPRTFDLVALLARNRGRTVTRDEIFHELWPGRFVSDAALSSQIRSARKALGDDGALQAVIATVHGRGFRLRKHLVASERASEIPHAPLERKDPIHCVTVLPCAAPGEDERGAVIAGGLTEDLINALSRNRWMRVVTRNAAFALGRVQLARGKYGSAIDALETALELNPCHALSHCGLGDSLVSDGRSEASLPSFERALALSPHDPFRWAFMSYRSLAHMFMGDHEGAVHWARSATLVPNAHYWARANLVSWLAHSGDLGAARANVPALMRTRPGFSCDFARSRLFFLRDPAHLALLLDGLRRAGVP